MATDARSALLRSLLSQAHAAGGLPRDLRQRIAEALRQPAPLPCRQPLSCDTEDPYCTAKLESTDA
jgi:hypothetical protein